MCFSRLVSVFLLVPNPSRFFAKQGKRHWFGYQMITNALSFSTSNNCCKVCCQHAVLQEEQGWVAPSAVFAAGQCRTTEKLSLGPLCGSQFLGPSPSLHRCWKGSIFRSEPEESSQGHVASRQCLSLCKFIFTECKQICGTC